MATNTERHTSGARVALHSIGQRATRLFYECLDGARYAVLPDDEHAARMAMARGETVVIEGHTADQFARLVPTGMRPIVHLNGSGADAIAAALRAVELVELYSEAEGALAAALRAVDAAAPNARDYPLGDAAFKSASELHRRFMDQLRAMRAEFVCAREHVQEQVDAREARRG